MTFKDGSKQRGGSCYRQHQSLKKYIRGRDGYTCQLCGKEGWQVDHIIPYAVSQDSSIDNLRVLCRACNIKTRRQGSNHRLTITDWWREIESLVA